MSIEKRGNSDLNVWTLKPWWCQPWSIVLTTIAVPSVSWFILHWLWLTAGLGVLFGVWMAFFLGVYPQLMAVQLREEAQQK